MFEYSGEWNYFWLQKNSLEARQDGTGEYELIMYITRKKIETL